MRRSIVLAAAVLITAGVAAVTSLAHAETVRPGPSGAPSVSPMLAALSRDLKMTPEQAGIRLSREKWAATTSAELERQLGPAFAGDWLTNDGQTLNVAISDPAKAAIVLAAGAVPKPVTRSWASLKKVVKLLDTAERPAGIVDWSIDPATNSVVVNAERGTESSVRRWLQTHVPSTAIRVATSAGRPHPTGGTLRGGGRVVFSSNIIGSGFQCSIGFAVKNGILTAGHCGKVGSEATDPDDGAIGEVKSSDFSVEGDMAYVETTPIWELTREVWMYDGQKTTIVKGSQEAPIGASVCRSGTTSGWHCGTIQSKDVTANYPSVVVDGLTKTSACAESGDSGGPVVAGDQAQGLTSGTYGDCTKGGGSLFQPVNEILTRYNLQLY